MATVFVREYAFAGDQMAMGLPAGRGEWGLLFCVNENNLRYTYAGDGEHLRLLLDIAPDAVPGTTGTKDNATLFGGESPEFPPQIFPLKRRG